MVSSGWVFVDCSPSFDEDVSQVWNYENSVNQYAVYGGTGVGSVTAQASNLTTWLNKARAKYEEED